LIKTSVFVIFTNIMSWCLYLYLTYFRMNSHVYIGVCVCVYVALRLHWFGWMHVQVIDGFTLQWLLPHMIYWWQKVDVFYVTSESTEYKCWVCIVNIRTDFFVEVPHKSSTHGGKCVVTGGWLSICT